MELQHIRKRSIIYYSYILLFIVLFFYGLAHASKFLIPVSLAALFAMLLWPISKFCERKGLSRAAGAGVCVFILLLFLFAFVLFFASQVSSLVSGMGDMQGQLSKVVDQVREFLQNKFGINPQNLFPGSEGSGGASGGNASGINSGSAGGTGAGAEGSGLGSGGEGSSAGGDSGTSGSDGSTSGSGKDASSGFSLNLGSGGGISSYISGIASQLTSLAVVTFQTVVGIIIITVYTFLMLLYRHIFINFIKKVSPKEEESEKVSRQVAGVSKDYLLGRLIVIAIVAVINSVGLTLIGIKHGIFFGVLAAVLDLIPYIGIIIGAGLPLIMSLINHENLWPFFAVLGLFVFVQLLENYYLTPKIVGSHVRLNPLFTLMAVIVGGYLWGVAGMILFIPFLGMLKVIFDHVGPLHPYGYLIGDPENRTEKK